MICRIWHGWTTPTNAEAYIEGEARALLERFDTRSAHSEVRRPLAA